MREIRMRKKAVALVRVSIITLFVVTSFLISPSVAKADAPSIIINEIMYNPLSDIDGDEFLELYNTTNATIDISGWCFTVGITLCFNTGTTIAANGYGVISPDSTQTQATYGVTTIGTYIGKLSNGGETVTLTDNNSNIVNSLDYDDASPWPTSPDGTGPSLELNNPTLENTLASSWSASLSNNGTPGQENSGVNIDLPVVTNVNHPQDVTVATTPTITANVTNATSINLVYKVMFNADQTLPMYDDGAHYDGLANDGVYGAMIPAQAEGNLVRYKVSATNNDGTVTSPGNDDTISYYGYTIQKTITTQLPVVQLFISDSDYADLIDDPSGVDETYFDCVIVVGNQVFDASQIRLKGEYTRTFEKQSFKVKLPKGYSLDIEGVTNSPINEFHLNSDIASNNYITSLLSWNIFEHAGFPVPSRTKAYVQRNGQFEGAYTLIEKYDKGWELDNQKFRSSEIYEDFYEKKQPDDGNVDLITEWRSEFESLSGLAKTNYLKQTVDIPSIINYMAAESLSRNADWSVESNTLSLFDSSGTERWSFLPWDFDLSFRGLPYYEPIPGVPQGTGEADMINPYEVIDSIPVEKRFVFTAIWDDHDLREMYKRRIRTLIDEIYTSGKIKQWRITEFNRAKEAIELDDQIWHEREEARLIEFYTQVLPLYVGIDIDDPLEFQAFIDQASPPNLPVQTFNVDTVYKLPNPSEKMMILDYGLDKMKNLYSYDYTQRGVIPSPQPMSPKIQINEFNYNPAGGSDQEYLELYNPNSFAVDISNWSLNPGIDLTFPGGSVIPSQSHAIVVKKDTTFRSQYGGSHLVLGEYSGNLSNEGETITLRRPDNSISSEVTYASSGNWSPLANGSGYSQALIRPTANESLSACWAPSVNGGTPGASNTNYDQAWLAVHQGDCRDKDYITASNISNTLASTGIDTRIIATFAFLVSTAGGARLYWVYCSNKKSKVYLSVIEAKRK